MHAQLNYQDNVFNVNGIQLTTPVLELCQKYAMNTAGAETFHMYNICLKTNTIKTVSCKIGTTKHLTRKILPSIGKV